MKHWRRVSSTSMRCVDLYDDVLEFGLLRKIGADGDEDIKASVMEARATVCR